MNLSLDCLAMNAQPDIEKRRAAANKQTAIILGSIAVVFFFGVIAAQLIGTPTASIAVLGTAVLLYLAVAIGRHLRK